MKKYALIVVTLIICFSTLGQTVNKERTNSKLALNYYRAKEYDKAASLYKNLYENSKLQHYFDYYINCLTELKEYEEAEKELKKKIRRSKSSTDYITLGHTYQLMENIKEANSQYDKALKILPRNFGLILNTASKFIKYREFDYAEKTYLKGKQMLPREDYSYYLALTYGYQRNHEKMLEAYLDMIDKDEKNLKRVQGRLASALYLDVDNNLRDMFKRKTILRIQKNAEKIVFNQLLAWFYQQEKDYKNALRQLIAIDKRTNNEGQQIITLSKSVAQRKSYVMAIKGLDYLLSKNEKSKYYNQALTERMNIYYDDYMQDITPSKEKTDSLFTRFKNTFTQFDEGYSDAHLTGLYGEFLCYYYKQPQMAIDLLLNFTKNHKVSRMEYFDLETQIADFYVVAGKLWDATLLYAQIIETNKNNSLGDEVKLKKAKLGYYMGNFEWAQAQLDALKASTSKLIANDAMELSMLITNNYDMDTTDVAMRMFARADLYLFKKEYERAFEIFDSIKTKYSYHSLHDDILFRKAMTYKVSHQYKQAEISFKEIIDEYGYELLADNAKFELGLMYEEDLNRPIEAANLYKDLIINHSGSIFVIESRKRYRILEPTLPEDNQEVEFFNSTN